MKIDRDRDSEKSGLALPPPQQVDGLEMEDFALELVSRARSQGVELAGENGLLTAMVRQVLQAGLNVEMAEHLGYQRYAVDGHGSGNSRNGSYPKTVITDVGPVEVQMPRDRVGSFSPLTVPKHARRLDGLSGNVISLYAKGMTTGDIQAHLFEMYDTEISRETISKITDAIVEDMHAWQNRPLDPVYAVVLIDAIVIKIRGSQVANRPVYVAIGVDMAGERDVLGMWIGPTGGEGAKQWATMLTELRNRGMLDALIVCCDGLKGLPDSIRATWPQATVQTCVVHMVRNSLTYASKKDWQPITKAMREIYTASTVDVAVARFQEFSDDWKAKYPAMIQSWERSWPEFVPFLEFPTELRRVVYTTNAIESLNARFRKRFVTAGTSPTSKLHSKCCTSSRPPNATTGKTSPIKSADGKPSSTHSSSITVTGSTAPTNMNHHDHLHKETDRPHCRDG